MAMQDIMITILWDRLGEMLVAVKVDPGTAPLGLDFQ